MELVKDVCGGSFETWENLPWATRRAWLYLRILQNKKQQKQMEKPLETPRVMPSVVVGDRSRRG